jgi:hypothetical protein
MVMKFLLLLTTIFLASCATTPEVEYRDVLKRVPYCPAPPVSVRPTLDIETYGWNERNLVDSPEILIVSLNQLKDYSMKLEKVIESFRKYSDDNLNAVDDGIRVSTMIPTEYPSASGLSDTENQWNETSMFNFVEEYKKLQRFKEKKSEN